MGGSDRNVIGGEENWFGQFGFEYFRCYEHGILMRTGSWGTRIRTKRRGFLELVMACTDCGR